jgi:energy-coupling factor transporter ATP-binding protein EcfA2
MRLTQLILEKFKKVDKVDISLLGLNVLVGGNNAGKSSVLQGIHFSVIAAIASREAGRDTFTQDSLLYCPARDFESLRHGLRYTNQTHFGHLRLFAITEDEAKAQQYEVRIYRGRNEGNVGCQRSGAVRLGALVSNREQLFSIYVPGLAGVSQFEQHRSESVVRRGVASGDANLYLRNVMLLIQEKGKLEILAQRMKNLFPKFEIWISYDAVNDIYIDVHVSTTGTAGRRCPLELAGTGVLQALQIFSYVTLFEPRLLLLDEPDSHLHPDNQVLLAAALQETAATTTTQVIVSTHSRHLVDALHEDANFVWLKDGVVHEQGVGLSRLPVLLELGALDSFDKLQGGAYDWVFLTEDSDRRMLETLLTNVAFPMARCLFFSYKTSANLEAAKLLTNFILTSAPGTKVVIHRDRDFMTVNEVEVVAANITSCGATPFITEGCDIESYFLESQHLANRIGAPLADVVAWLDQLATKMHAELQHLFTRKRDEIKSSLYREKLNVKEFPDTLKLLGAAIPLSTDKRHGKKMIKKVRAGLKARFNATPDITTASPFLTSARLTQILAC